jgi:hypothetical protein
VVFVTLVAIGLTLRAAVRNGIKDSIRRTQQSLEQARAAQVLRDVMALSWISADPAFSAAVRRASEACSSAASRRRAEKSVQQYARHARDLVRSELVAVTGLHGRLLTVLPAGPTASLLAATSGKPGSGVWDAGGTPYTVTTTPVRLHGRIVGELSTASRFDFAGLAGMGPMLLMRGGRIVRSTFSPGVASQIPDLPADCARAGCELHLNGEDFLVTPVARAAAGLSLGDQDQLLSFRSIDATGDIVRRFWIALLAAAIAGVLLPIGLIAWMQRSQALSSPQAALSENSGELHRLAEAIDRAATSAAHSSERLATASLDFVRTMAQVLDARDPHTASHSSRVSDYAAAIATTMCLSPGEIETIRVGAQLHDIGKIGIPDAVFQKNGHLTTEEYRIIQQHPRIGRKILERSSQFEKYLPFVELHHEDMDGGGYPHGLKGYEVPLAVRIVKVADMFDALTSDRAYRQAISPAQAYEVLMSCAGAQLDPEVVRALLATFAGPIRSEAGPLLSLARLPLA